MRYRLKKSEFFSACTYMVWRQYTDRVQRKWRLFVLPGVFLLSLIQGAAGHWRLFLFSCIVLLSWLLWYLLAVYTTYKNNIRQGVLADTELLLEDGRLKIRGRTCTEWSASQINRVLQKRKLTFIVRKIALNQDMYLIIPNRVFAGEMARDAFLKRLGEAVAEARQKEAEKGQALYQGLFYMDKSMLYRSLTAVNKKLLEQRKGMRLTSAALIAVFVAAIISLAGFFWLGEINAVLLGTGVFAGIAAGFWMTRKKSIEKRFARSAERLLKQKYFRDFIGDWYYEFYEDRILFGTRAGENCLDWESCQGMLELSDMYLFYNDRCGYLFSVPRQMIPEEERENFLRFCEEKIPREIVREARTQKRRLPAAVQILLILLVCVLAYIAIVAVVAFMVYQTKESGISRDYKEEEYDEDFVFLKEDYPDYLPIEEQIEVLTELGFTVPESAVDYYHDWMEDSEYGKLYVEGRPYYMILSDLGTPHYDMDTRQFLGYSEQVYWFDFEGWDISKDYIEILEGVQALTDGEVVFVGSTEHCEDVNWNKGTGTIRITFWSSGHPYEYKAQVDGDWLDGGFIAFLNEVLVQEGYEKHLYACTDDGQGNILFYRDEAWAKEFMEKTGITLSLEAQ